MVGKFEAVFDLGSYEAIEEIDRKRYSDFMFEILEKDFRYVLNGYEYNEEKFKGPPRSIPREQVYDLFSRTFADGESFKRSDGVDDLLLRVSSFLDQTSSVTILEEGDFTESGRQRFNIEGTMTKFVYLIKGI